MVIGKPAVTCKEEIYICHSFIYSFIVEFLLFDGAFLGVDKIKWIVHDLWLHGVPFSEGKQTHEQVCPDFFLLQFKTNIPIRININ